MIGLHRATGFPTPALRRCSRAIRCAAGDLNPPSGNRLAAIIKRKQRQLSAELGELGTEGLEQRLQSAAESPARPDHRLARAIADALTAGRPALVAELSRGDGAHASAEQLARQATALVDAGVDAVAVRTDADDSPAGLADLFAVVRAVGARVPVVQRDWMLHLLQIASAKEAGAAGVLGAVASVTGPRGTPVLSSFAAAVGLDCPVEVVNIPELRAAEAAGVPFFALNVSVGLSVGIAGVGADAARGLLGELPRGALSLVGVRSVGEARAARQAGADALLVGWELVRQHAGGAEASLVAALRGATDGDD